MINLNFFFFLKFVCYQSNTFVVSPTNVNNFMIKFWYILWPDIVSLKKNQYVCKHEYGEYFCDGFMAPGCL